MADPLGQQPGPDPDFWRGIRWGVGISLAIWAGTALAAFGLVVLLSP